MGLKKRKHIDDGAPIGRYREEIFCVCPNCNGPALVRGVYKYAIPFWVERARVQCLRCVFSRDWTSEADEWKGPVIGSVRQPCPQCGHKWLVAEVRKENYNDKIKQTATIECSACHESSELKQSWQKDRYTNEPIDPYFGFPLWLQSGCCGNTLWAYNRRHLQTLKSYVAAKLRDRRQRQKWSMSSRLPQWIKSAKDRDAILKCISRLELRLEEIGK